MNRQIFIYIYWYFLLVVLVQANEWDCTLSTNAGTFTRSTDCTISGGNNVVVTNTLEIIGGNTDMNNLVTITAATNRRHFVVNSGTLSLRYVNLTGGDVLDINGDGGSISINYGEMHIFFSVLFENKAEKAGAVSVENGKAFFYNSSLIHNTAAVFGGGIYSYNSIVRIFNGKILDNDGGNSPGQGGGMYGRASDILLFNTTISSNHADKRGGALYIYANENENMNTINITKCVVHNNTIRDSVAVSSGGGAIFLHYNVDLTIRETSFVSNNANTGRGHDIMTNRQDVSGTPMISIVNSYFEDKNAIYDYPVDSGCDGCTSNIGCSPGFVYTEKDLWDDKTLQEITVAEMKDCGAACLLNPSCFSYEYMASSNRCKMKKQNALLSSNQYLSWVSCLRTHQTCASVPPLCTVAPFTGTCSAVDEANPTLGILCNYNADTLHSKTCEVGEHVANVSVQSSVPLATPACALKPGQWDCASSTNTGNFTRSTDCTISGGNNVVVTNTLEIIGGNTDMNILVTITAATNHRHFYVNGEHAVLTIRYLKLTGGNVTSNGGSIYNSYGKLVVFASMLHNNVAFMGGGIQISKAFASIINTTFYQNEADNRGGAVRIVNSNVTFDNCAITNNKAKFDGGGISGVGGALGFLNISVSHTFIQKNELTSNANYGGSGIIVTGFQKTNAIIGIYDSFINNNTDGGLRIQMASGTVLNTVFDGNDVSTRGGAINVHGADLVLNRCTIVSNTAAKYGGGLYITGYYSYASSNVIIAKTIIQNNKVKYIDGVRGGGGIYIKAASHIVVRETNFISNRAVNNRGDDIFAYGSHSEGIPNITTINSHFNVYNSNSIYSYITPPIVPIHLYKFGNDGKTTAFDTSMQPYVRKNGVLHGNDIEIENNALCFSEQSINSKSYLELPPNITEGLKTISIELRVSASDTNWGYARLFQFGGTINGNADSIILHRWDGNDTHYGNLAVTVAPPSGDWSFIFTNVGFNTLNRTHVVLVLNGKTNEVKLYVDSLLAGSVTVTFALIDIIINTRGNYIGRSLNNYDPGFHGKMHEFAIWGIALSPEIADSNKMVYSVEHNYIVRIYAGKNQYLNLAEVEVYDSVGNRLQLSQEELGERFSTTLYPASDCNDGIGNNFCHSKATTGKNYVSFAFSTASTGVKVKYYNRCNCCDDRIATGKIVIYTANNPSLKVEQDDITNPGLCKSKEYNISLMPLGLNNALTKTCSSNVCNESPFTGTCAAQDDLDPKFGVVCPSSCPSNKHFYATGISTGCHTIREWGCSAGAYSNAGIFKLSNDCTIAGSNHVTVTNKLNITGTNKDMNNLVTITAATNHRHFSVDGGTLSLRYVKLTGGNAGNENGGSIYINDENTGGKLQLDFSILYGNKAKYGGGIYSDNKFVSVYLYNCSIVYNVAVSGGGLYVDYSPLFIQKSEISNNFIAFSAGGGIHARYNTILLNNTKLSNNSAGWGAGAIYTRGINDAPLIIVIEKCIIEDNVVRTTAMSYYGGGGVRFVFNINATIRETRFVSNYASNLQGHDIYAGTSKVEGVPTISIVNSYFSNPRSASIFNEHGSVAKTCSSITCPNHDDVCMPVYSNDTSYGVTCCPTKS